jgi:hypothetical protein
MKVMEGLIRRWKEYQVINIVALYFSVLWLRVPALNKDTSAVYALRDSLRDIIEGAVFECINGM